MITVGLWRRNSAVKRPSVVSDRQLGGAELSGFHGFHGVGEQGQSRTGLHNMQPLWPAAAQGPALGSPTLTLLATPLCGPREARATGEERVSL